MDINQCDKLNIQGIGHTVYSIAVDKGHGYLRLKNDEYFLGGWIEVGQEIIRTVSEDMLLVVPEGTYDVLVSAQGVSGTKKVTIKRNEGKKYQVAYEIVPLRLVAKETRHMPATFINKAGNDVTQDSITYATPLVGTLPPCARFKQLRTIVSA